MYKRQLPHSRITVLELRADVIALRGQFAIPPDDERFRVIHADASRYMASLRGAADVLLVDGFDEDGLPPALGSAGFYADCRRALRPGGVLVANVFSYDPQYPAVLRRLRACFHQRVGSFHGIAGNNRLLFAIKGGGDASAKTAGPTPAQRALQRAAHRRGPAWGLAHRLLAHWTVFRLRWLRAGRGAQGAQNKLSN